MFSSDYWFYALMTIIIILMILYWLGDDGVESYEVEPNKESLFARLRARIARGFSKVVRHDTKKIRITYHYSPKCQACVGFDNDWKIISGQIRTENKDVILQKVNEMKAKTQDVTRYPTIRITHMDKKIDFVGERTVENVLGWIRQTLEEFNK